MCLQTTLGIALASDEDGQRVPNRSGQRWTETASNGEGERHEVERHEVERRRLEGATAEVGSVNEGESR